MIIQRNGGYSYEENNITAENGWTKWYDWNVIRKHTRIINVCLAVIVAIAAFASRQYLVKNGVAHLFLCLIVALLVWLLVITPIHEILHLLPLAGFRMDDRCVITIGKGAVSAIYNGKTTRFKQCISTILPVIVWTIVLLPLTLLCPEQIRLFLIFILILNIYGSYTDVYMLFHIMKAINKKDIIFGLYRKVA